MAARPKKRPDDTEALSRMIRREFGRVGKRLDGLASKREMEQFRRYVDGGFRATTATLGAIHEEVLGLQAMDADIGDLQVRVKRIERKLGMKAR